VARRGTQPEPAQLVTSDARTALGVDAAGNNYVPRVKGGLYRVADTVGCDVAQMRQCDARLTSIPTAAASFAVRPSTWSPASRSSASTAGGRVHTDAEGYATRTVIDEVARTLAEDYLDDGDYDGARWAARQGLVGVPGQIGLYTILLRIADSRAEAEALMDEARAVLTDDDGPEYDDMLLHDLTDVYNDVRSSLAA